MSVVAYVGYSHVRVARLEIVFAVSIYRS